MFFFGGKSKKYKNATANRPDKTQKQLHLYTLAAQSHPHHELLTDSHTVVLVCKTLMCKAAGDVHSFKELYIYLQIGLYFE